MDIQLLTIDQVQIFLIILCRIAGFIGAIPVFSSAQNPAMAKAAFTMALTWALFPILQQVIITVPDFSLLPLTLLIISEVLIGALLALIARLLFVAIEFGAEVIGFQMGFAAANVYDPQNQNQLQILSRFQNIFAVLIFFTINGHFLFFEALLHSFSLLPPGGIDLTGDAVPYLMQLASQIFVLGIQFSAPVLAALLLNNLILGALSRVFPQLNVFMLSFPVNITIAFTAMAITLNLVALILTNEFDDLGSKILNMLDLLHP